VHSSTVCCWELQFLPRRKHCLYIFFLIQAFGKCAGKIIFHFFKAPRSALGPSQSPIQCVLEAISLGVKRPWREADHTSAQCRGQELLDLYLLISFVLTACTGTLSVRAQCRKQIWVPHLYIILN
jgi:hypothetical protein